MTKSNTQLAIINLRYYLIPFSVALKLDKAKTDFLKDQSSQEKWSYYEGLKLAVMEKFAEKEKTPHYFNAESMKAEESRRFLIEKNEDIPF